MADVVPTWSSPTSAPGWTVQRGRWYYKATVTAGNINTIFMPISERPFTIRLVPGVAGSMALQTSIDNIDNIMADTSTDWQAWAYGTVTSITTDVLLSAVVAIKVTATTTDGVILMVA